MDNITTRDFRECEQCSSKSGTPLLCESCIYNRQLVSELQKRVKEHDGVLEIVRCLLCQALNDHMMTGKLNKCYIEHVIKIIGQE